MEWEYNFQKILAGSLEELDRGCNEEGRSDWELASMVYVPETDDEHAHLILAFKKPRD